MSFPITIITGPTASGKSETAFFLAEKIKAEIISCDAMLIYRQAPVLACRLSIDFLSRIRHHFVGTVDIRSEYNVFNYFKGASEKIKRLYELGTKIIICGGSGLYLKALCDGLISGAGRDESLRLELLSRVEREGLVSLYRELSAVDPESASRISAADQRRIIRALEVYHLTGFRFSDKSNQHPGICQHYPVTFFGLGLERPRLYEAIENRTDEMFEHGAVEEVKKLRAIGLGRTAEKIIGIKEIGLFLDGEASLDRAKELIRQHTRNYAKRQMTWFRREKRITWIDRGCLSPKNASKLIAEQLRLQA